MVDIVAPNSWRLHVINQRSTQHRQSMPVAELQPALAGPACLAPRLFGDRLPVSGARLGSITGIRMAVGRPMSRRRHTITATATSRCADVSRGTSCGPHFGRKLSAHLRLRFVADAIGQSLVQGAARSLPRCAIACTRPLRVRPCGRSVRHGRPWRCAALSDSSFARISRWPFPGIPQPPSQRCRAACRAVRVPCLRAGGLA